MRIIFFGLLIVLALLMVGAVVAYNVWGVWGLLGWFALIVLGIWGLKLLVGRLLTGLFFGSFKMKGKVLRDAIVTVHEVAPAPPPDRSDEDDLWDEDDFDDPEEAEEYRLDLEEERLQQQERDARLQWYFVDMTITPLVQDDRGFTHWEPSDLTVIDPESRADNPMDEDDDDDEIGEIVDVLVWDDQEQEFCADDACKYFGPQRIRLHIGVEPGQRRLAMRYYFEKFGEIQLPAA